MQYLLSPVKLKGCVYAPPSKSQAHRLLLAAIPAKGTCVIEHVAFSDDMIASFNAIKALGKNLEVETESLGNRITIHPQSNISSTPVIDCKESGSTLRFSIPLALAVTGSAVFKGEGRLGSRPLMVYEELFKEKDILWEADPEGLPLHVKGKLKPGIFRVRGDISSQFITGLLLALPLLEGESVLEIEGVLESAPYVDITLDVLRKYGVIAAEEERHKKYRIPGNQIFQGVTERVEGDWSQAAFHILGGILGEGVCINGLDGSSCQGDKRIVSLLHSMGADIRWDGDGLVARPSELIGMAMDISDCPDLAPVLALACCLAKGNSRITGAKRLRMKESDRIQSVGSTLVALGAKVQCTDDGFEIDGVEFLQGGRVSSHNDHRIAMMVAIAAGACNEFVFLDGAEAVAKSYPDFWEHYKLLGGSIYE